MPLGHRAEFNYSIQFIGKECIKKLTWAIGIIVRGECHGEDEGVEVGLSMPSSHSDIDSWPNDETGIDSVVLEA